MSAALESTAAAAHAKAEPEVVQTPTVACDGGVGPLGHPRVYLHFGDDREIVCPYCSRAYVLAEGVKPYGH